MSDDGSVSIRTIGMFGNGVVADLLEDAGIRTLADVRALDLEDGDVLNRLLLASADNLTPEDEVEVKSAVRHAVIMLRAYNRLILIHDPAKVEADVPLDFRCTISHQWPDDPVRTPRGHLYERRWIEQWIRILETDPIMWTPLSVDDLTPVDGAVIRRAREQFDNGNLFSLLEAARGMP